MCVRARYQTEQTERDRVMVCVCVCVRVPVLGVRAGSPNVRMLGGVFNRNIWQSVCVCHACECDVSRMFCVCFNSGDLFLAKVSS